MRCGLALALLVWVVPGPPARACRYNVRDLGFIDVEGRAYRLVVWLGAGAGAGAATAAGPGLENAAATALRDSNVRLELIGADPGPDGGVPEPFLASGIDTPPAAALVAPDGRARPVSLWEGDGTLASQLTDRLDALVSSPVREQLVRRAAEGFAAVLCIEGTDAAANDRARATIRQAIEEIRTQMRWMPKVIAEPPALVTLAAAGVARESVLLWALGETAEARAEPRAVVIYGRARRIGPVLAGDAIRGAELQRILATLGADCECGMDLAWTRGTLLPVRWADGRRDAVAKELGFDPDHPMVKLEASQILGKQAGARTPGPGASPAFGYQEIEIGGAGKAGGSDPGREPTRAAAPGAETAAPAATPAMVADARPALFSSVVMLAVLGGGVVLAGVWILVRSKDDED